MKAKGESLNDLIKRYPNILLDEEDLKEFGHRSAYFANGYVLVWYKGKSLYLHRLIMNLPEGKVDHKNRIRLDCRKENLRVVDSFVNAQNAGLHYDSSTGFKGVDKLERWNIGQE